MAPAIFIPPTPSPTDSDESYYFPITTTDPTSPPVLDLALIYFGLQASAQLHQCTPMSSNSSTNPSNASSTENHIPLPVHPLESRNHLCRPIPLRPHWQHTPTLTPTSSEPSQKGSSPPSPDMTPTRTSKSAASKNKSPDSTTELNTMKTYSNVHPTGTLKTMDESPSSSFP